MIVIILQLEEQISQIQWEIYLRLPSPTSEHSDRDKTAN